jgi:hypothetical protein
MQPVPRSSAVPCLTDPGTQPSLQMVAGEVYMGRERPPIVEDPSPPTAPFPPPVVPLALPVPLITVPIVSPPASTPAPARKRLTRRERRRIRAARLRARLRKISPYAAAQLTFVGLAIVLAEWLEVHGNQPLRDRLIVAFGIGLVTASLWLVYLHRHRARGPRNNIRPI